jgi:hypothetical protein
LLNLSPVSRLGQPAAIPFNNREFFASHNNSRFLPQLNEFSKQFRPAVPRILSPSYKETVSQWACPGILLVFPNFWQNPSVPFVPRHFFAAPVIFVIYHPIPASETFPRKCPNQNSAIPCNSRHFFAAPQNSRYLSTNYGS